MRSMLLLLAVSALGGPGRAAYADEQADVQANPISITQVLYRSQQARLDSLPAAEQGTPASEIVQLSFQRLLHTVALTGRIELRVTAGDTVAETLHGHVIVVNEAVARLPEGERMFILAHELGHVVMSHWAQMGELFQRYVPGAVTQAQTDAVSASLGREATGLARQHEFDADAFALRTLRALGHADADATAVMSRFGFQRDTATHPGTRQRLAALCAIDAGKIETAGLDAPP
ncbi:MAG: M48 family metalloprotease [Pseudomonadota bacterium]|nr:M48 family metalloprotease [Pseudomonadota bacterium]